jgi:hypothetical protein
MTSLNSRSTASASARAAICNAASTCRAFLSCQQNAGYRYRNDDRNGRPQHEQGKVARQTHQWAARTEKVRTESCVG